MKTILIYINDEEFAKAKDFKKSHDLKWRDIIIRGTKEWVE